MALVDKAMECDCEVGEKRFAWIGFKDAALSELVILLEVICLRTGVVDALDGRAICCDDGDNSRTARDCNVAPATEMARVRPR